MIRRHRSRGKSVKAHDQLGIGIVHDIDCGQSTTCVLPCEMAKGVVEFGILAFERSSVVVSRKPLESKAGLVHLLLTDESLVSSVCLPQTLVGFRRILQGFDELLVGLWRQ